MKTQNQVLPEDQSQSARRAGPTRPVEFQQQYRRFPILIRLLIGNSIVILAGAVIGTLITRSFTSLDIFELILLFSGIGILVSLGMNYWVIRVALIPLRELRQAVERIKPGAACITETELMNADPDIHHLVQAINSMLERLDQRTSLLSALSERAINAQEEERKRIARTLHDDTAQSLSSLIIQLERIESSDTSLSPAVTNQLVKTRLLATDILEELRQNIWDLRPSILDDLGLCPAIRWLARLRLGEANMQVDFDLPPEVHRLPAHLETTLFRITQEAINNIILHSGAKKVSIHLLSEQTHICLDIHDDGHGFDVSDTVEQAVSRKRLGLLGIQERTSLVGGFMHIKSQPGEGTNIRVCVPLSETSLINGDEASEKVLEALRLDEVTK